MSTSRRDEIEAFFEDADKFRSENMKQGKADNPEGIYRLPMKPTPGFPQVVATNGTIARVER